MKKEIIYLMTVKEMEKAGIHTYNHNRGGNKKSDEKHIKSIMMAFKQYGGYGHFPAIMVDEKTKTILDGNTRFLAAKRLAEIPDDGGINLGKTYFSKIDMQVRVHFINLGDEDSVDDFVRLFNNTQKKWMTMDYIANAKSRGFDTYKKFEEFCEANGFVSGGNISYSYALPLFGIKRSLAKDPDKFKIGDGQYQFAQVLAEETKKMDEIINKFLETPVGTQGGWIEARNKSWYSYRESRILFDSRLFFKALNKYLESKGVESVPIKSCKTSEWDKFFENVEIVIIGFDEKETEALTTAL